MWGIDYRRSRYLVQVGQQGRLQVSQSVSFEDGEWKRAHMGREESDRGLSRCESQGRRILRYPSSSSFRMISFGSGSFGWESLLPQALLLITILSSRIVGLRLATSVDRPLVEQSVRSVPRVMYTPWAVLILLYLPHFEYRTGPNEQLSRRRIQIEGRTVASSYSARSVVPDR